MRPPTPAVHYPAELDKWLGCDMQVNTDSTWYKTGTYIGYAHDAAFAGAGIWRAGTKAPASLSLACRGRTAATAARTGAQYTKSSLQLGQEMHRVYRLAEHAPELGRFKEFTGIRGIRPDFVDLGSKTVYELKPHNPRAVQSGLRQLSKYKALLEEKYGGAWKTILDVYQAIAGEAARLWKREDWLIS